MLLDEDLAWLMGLFLAEGSYGKVRGYLTGLSFSLHEKELDKANRILKIVSRYNINGSITKIKNSKCLQVKVNNNILADIFKEFLGEYCDKKKLHPILTFAPFNLQRKLLEGWRDGDGHYRKKDGTWHITTTSKDLMYQMFEICLRLRIHTTCYDWKIVSHGKKQPYTLFIRDNTPKQRHSFYLGDYYVTTIKDIKEMEGEFEVYNFEVEEDNSYLANNILVHNCCDRRGDDRLTLRNLNSFAELFDFWGSEKHWDMAMGTDVNKCGKCTYRPHNQIYENVILKDKMGLSFI